MPTVQTALLSVAFLGATIGDGWCPEPSDVSYALGGSTGATAAAVGNPSAKVEGNDNIVPAHQDCVRIFTARCL
jgi:hypothetical protein